MEPFRRLHYRGSTPRGYFQAMAIRWGSRPNAGVDMSKFHLGWFLGPGITVQGWNSPNYAPSYDWTQPEIFQDGARALERGCFDFLILEDTSAIPKAYKGGMDFYLKNATMTPKLDPAVLTPYLLMATKRLPPPP